MRKSYLSLTVVIFLMISVSISAQDEIYLSNIEGLKIGSNNEIAVGFPVTFTFNFNVNSGGLHGSTNGFRVYSPDGATWQAITYENNPALNSLYDGGVFLNSYSITGEGADTVGLGAFKLFASGITSPFDNWAIKINTLVSEEMIGKTICIDSSYYPPSGIWNWGFDESGSIAPDWDGPHCYIISDCCAGIRGDVDYNNVLGIGDLDRYVQYMFIGTFWPPCMTEADINGDGETTVSDLSYIVDYLFQGGPPPAPCP